MTSTELLAMDQLEAVQTLTDHPDPDPDQLPMLSEEAAALLQQQTAGHLCRAILRAEDDTLKLKERMKADIQSWAALIAKRDQHTENWRAIIRAWMERTGTTKLQTPWFSAFLSKGRKRLTWEQEDKIIGILDAIGASDDCVKTVRSVMKKEFQVVFDSVPGKFDGLVTEEQGETSLVIRKTA